jgi:NAD(P)-dependent dehydrogenase (short-subunit alcohol dehydrogenase family)
MKRFKNKTVLITGAGQGLGKETAELFVKEGGNVLVSDINLDNLNKLKGNLAGRSYEIDVIKADISKLDDIEEMVNKAVSRYGKIDILVNNAGVSITKKVMNLNENDWDKVLNVNVKGTFFVSQRVAKQMIESRNGGCIINIASIAGEKGRPDFLAYAASKAAVINMTKSLALELAKYDIRINAIAPGSIDTSMWHDVVNKIALKKHCDKDDLARAWIEKIPMKRLAKPKDIADMILYLCSDEAAYITGQVINVCGGLSIV